MNSAQDVRYVVSYKHNAVQRTLESAPFKSREAAEWYAKLIAHECSEISIKEIPWH